MSQKWRENFVMQPTTPFSLPRVHFFAFTSFLRAYGQKTFPSARITYFKWSYCVEILPSVKYSSLPDIWENHIQKSAILFELNYN